MKKITLVSVLLALFLVGCGDKVDAVKEQATATVSEVADKATEVVGDVKDATVDAAGSVADKAKEMTAGAVETTTAAVGNVADKAKEMTAGAVETTTAAVGNVADKAKEMTAGAVETTTAVGNVTDKAKEMKDMDCCHDMNAEAKEEMKEKMENKVEKVVPATENTVKKMKGDVQVINFKTPEGKVVSLESTDFFETATLKTVEEKSVNFKREVSADGTRLVSENGDEIHFNTREGYLSLDGEKYNLELAK